MLKTARGAPAPAKLFAAAALIAQSGCLAVMPALAPKAKDVEANISAAFPYESRFAEVNGSQMRYVEVGTGDPIVLIHGNPTSAYLWRNVMPHLKGSGRVIALDLIGMGESDKPDIAYRFEDHAEYVAGFIEALGLQNITLVLHDWGGALGLDYAARSPDNVRAIVFLEAVMRPMSLKDADFGARYVFGRLRDPAQNHKIVAEDNYFVEKLLPMMTGRDLSDAEMAAYRAPFPTVESRRPVAQWPLEIPLDGEPVRNVRRIGANYAWLKAAETPVLMLYAEPGMIVRPNVRKALESELPRMRTTSVGSGLHYLQEVQPTRIGVEIARWIETRPGAEGD